MKHPTRTTTEGAWRYEHKLAVPSWAAAELLFILRCHPAGLRPIHHPRRVQSIYMDSLEGRALAENLAGVSVREKLRFRWYGADTTGVRGRMECKQRQNQLGAKPVCAVDTTLDIEGLPPREFLSRIRSGLPDGWAQLLSSAAVEPVQWIAYDRQYFLSRDDKVRVTVDRNLASWDQRGRARLSSRWATPIPHITIVEVKCDARDDDAAMDILRRLPQAPDKCSKFVLASAPANGLGAFA